MKCIWKDTGGYQVGNLIEHDVHTYYIAGSVDIIAARWRML